MDHTNSKTSPTNEAELAFRQTKKRLKDVAFAAAVTALVLMPEVALAGMTGGSNAATQFFCYIAQYFKTIVGSAALVAITMWAIEHIFGVSKLHDIVIKVGIAAAIVIGGATLIANSGLTSNCTI